MKFAGGRKPDPLPERNSKSQHQSQDHQRKTAQPPRMGKHTRTRSLDSFGGWIARRCMWLSGH